MTIGKVATMLRTTGLTVAPYGRQLCANVDLELAFGEVKGLVAPNGYGKTTLLRAVGGLLSKGVTGEVEADGVSVADIARYRRKVFYAPGDANMLQRSMNANTHLKAARAMWNSPHSVAEVAELCGVETFMMRPARFLSEGMKQQLTLAVAYMANVPYVLLDEPMNALDPTNSDRFAAIIGSMAAQGRAVLLSSHIFSGVASLCSSVYMFRQGGVEEVRLTSRESAAEGGSATDVPGSSDVRHASDSRRAVDAAELGALFLEYYG